ERAPRGGAVWGQTKRLLPPEDAGRQYRNRFPGAVLAAGQHNGGALPPLAAVVPNLPVALPEQGRSRAPPVGTALPRAPGKARKLCRPTRPFLVLQRYARLDVLGFQGLMTNLSNWQFAASP